jgi:hypothetical protein
VRLGNDAVLNSHFQDGTAMASDDEQVQRLTSVALRLKEAFEDKNAAALQKLFASNAMISADGHFHRASNLAALMKPLFEGVDQTYLDIVRIERIETDARKPFVQYAMDVAWVDRESWKEHVQKLYVAMELASDAKTKSYCIIGLTAIPRRDDGEYFDGPSPRDTFPDEVTGVGTRDNIDPWSIWY